MSKHSLSIAYAMKRRAMKHKHAAKQEDAPELQPEDDMPEMAEGDEMDMASPAKHLAMMVMKKKKMAEGGPVPSPSPSPDAKEDSGMQRLSIASSKKIGPTKGWFAEGGMVDDDEDMDNYLSDEEDDSGELDAQDDEAPEERRKGRLAAIMSKLHAKHFGR